MGDWETRNADTIDAAEVSGKDVEMADGMVHDGDNDVEMGDWEMRNDVEMGDWEMREEEMRDAYNMDAIEEAIEEEDAAMEDA